MPAIEAPYYPIIYVRGYAMTKAEISDTVATPYMGFNLGATKIRQAWDGKVQKLVFESPLIRLMKDYGYQDVYRDGNEIPGEIPCRSIVIYRYYEPADPDLGTGQTPSVMEAAKGLSDLILRVRNQICGGDPEAQKTFRVYLVAHSMGGLVCRCFLQNSAAGSDESRQLVDKVFTYATPHNGIEMAGINVPSFISMNDMSNFSRPVMRKYLDLPSDSGRVDSLGGKFDPGRFFSLIGTNSRDYAVAMGLSSALAGNMSDGLVRIDNAGVSGGPRAYVHRSHSGAYGIVNSEEGYQNLVRFLFGDVCVEGVLEVKHLPLPPEVQKAKDDDRKIRASYFFEATVSPRGAATFDLTRRTCANYSAILRLYDDLFKPRERGLDAPRSPFLFSLYLDTKRITEGRSVVFSADLAVSTTDYEIDGWLWTDRHIPGEFLFRNTLVLTATPPSRTETSWGLRYVWADERWSSGQAKRAEQEGESFLIPLESAKGFKATLRLNVGKWA